jgi:hypothetical protein
MSVLGVEDFCVKSLALGLHFSFFLFLEEKIEGLKRDEFQEARVSSSRRR